MHRFHKIFIGDKIAKIILKIIARQYLDFYYFFFRKAFINIFQVKGYIGLVGWGGVRGPMKGKCKKDVGKENAEIKVYKKRKKKSGG